MSLEVLQKKIQINNARQELINKAASAVDSPLGSFLRKFGFVSGVKIGDISKSWDVLLTLKFIEKNIAKDKPVLDIGCYASELIISLYNIGFLRLSGIDLNQNLHRMPHQNVIRYEVGDYMYTAFKDASFSVITAISVIEHGFQPQKLLGEISRLLERGGYFIASFDYWPDKIDTTGLGFFGMDWMIFSKEDVEHFISEAARYSLLPVGEIKFSADQKVISWCGRQYTFAWLVLEKKA
jgi:ubiquinone/menaquinone biosynthesis C-methylase UbiE